MHVLLDLIKELEANLDNINDFIKEKYKDINWNIVRNVRYNDEIFGSSMKVGDAWKIAKCAYSQLYNGLLNILNLELEAYYHSVYTKEFS